MDRVPELWPGSTVVCIACGPSLTQDDVNACMGQHVVAVNNAYQYAPWAEVLFSADTWWWKHWWDKGLSDFRGHRYTLTPSGAPYATVLRNAGRFGFSLDPHALTCGDNSGYAALNLAYLLGGRRVILLGYDCQPGPDGEHHCHPDHEGRGRRQAFAHWRVAYETLARKHPSDLEIINCTRETALTCFTRMSLDEALPEPVAP